MAIKKSMYAQKNEKLKNFKNTINDLLKSDILDEDHVKLKEVKNKLQESLELLEKFSFKSANSVFLDGKVSNGEEILKMIIDGTDYSKWQGDDPETVEDSKVKYLKEKYNVDFELDKVMCYSFSRSTKNRDALWIIIVTALPGAFSVELHTDRCGYMLEGLVNEDELIKGLEREMNE